jgi:hypothetical protein
VSKSAEAFVRIPRRFFDARRFAEISTAAFNAGVWITGRADYRTGRLVITISELLGELDRSPRERRTL